MAISISNLGTDVQTSVSSIATSSVSPSSNALLLCGVVSRMGSSTDPNTPTVSGNGLTWVQIATVLYDSDSSSRRRMTLFRAMGSSPSSGAVTASFGGQTQTDAIIIVDQATGVDTSGTNGSGAIVQSNTGIDNSRATDTLVVSLSAFSDASNATYGFFANGGNAYGPWTPGSGFTQLTDEYSGYSLTGTTEYKLSNDTTVDAVGYVTDMEIGGIALELKIASAPASTTHFLSLMGVGK